MVNFNKENILTALKFFNQFYADEFIGIDLITEKTGIRQGEVYKELILLEKEGKCTIKKQTVKIENCIEEITVITVKAKII